MKNLQILELSNLTEELTNCKEEKYTGKINIKSEKEEWQLYYQKGLVVWVTGGKHSYRRWLRNINHYLPLMDFQKNQHNAEDMLVDYWNYLLLQKIYTKHKLQPEPKNQLLQSMMSDVFFEIVQQMDYSSLKFERQPDIILKPFLASVDAITIFKQAQKTWVLWKKAGLEKVSPNVAPVIKKPELLKQLVNPSVYKNFQNFINGSNTLLDLSFKMNKDVLKISRSLLPYLQHGVIGFIKVADLPLPKRKVKRVSNLRSKSDVPLIACIDDSPQICKIVEKIITAHGMKFVGIQQPIEALPILIEKQPDLIFLDLMMPVMNGYELCSQLRRCSQFADTPIIMLTSSDAIFDRVRSKVFGLTEFMNKPVETTKIMDNIYKHLQSDLQSEQQEVPSSLNLAFS